MPEIRQNVITRDWVVIAHERAQRPHDYRLPGDQQVTPPAHKDTCPFCPGHESACPPETSRLPLEGAWAVRSFPNKFPVLQSAGERQRWGDELYRRVSGVGHHEVVVLSPRHDLPLALLPTGQVRMIFRLLQQRYRTLRSDRRVESIILFQNHGVQAGSSLEHPHAQIAATPVVPFQHRARLEEAIRYYDNTGRCVFCHTLEQELAHGERVVCANHHFVAFVPWAALSPFHLWIFPRRHASAFDQVEPEELDGLADLTQEVLLRLYRAVGNPDYNFSIRCVPTHLGEVDFFHWYLPIVPRVYKAAGFEIGSGMFINPNLPEDDARHLRECRLSA